MPKYLCHFPPCVINLNAIWKACIETPLATHSNSSAMSYGIVYVRTRRGWHILLFDSIWYILNGSLHSYERILSCILNTRTTASGKNRYFLFFRTSFARINVENAKLYEHANMTYVYYASIPTDGTQRTLATPTRGTGCADNKGV